MVEGDGLEILPDPSVAVQDCPISLVIQALLSGNVRPSTPPLVSKLVYGNRPVSRPRFLRPQNLPPRQDALGQRPQGCVMQWAAHHLAPEGH